VKQGRGAAGLGDRWIGRREKKGRRGGESDAEPREKKGQERKRKRKREKSGTRVMCVWFHKKIMLSSSNKSCADTWQWKITFYFKARLLLITLGPHHIIFLLFKN
jgi:hypothetical protein